MKKDKLKRYPNWICHECGMNAKKRLRPLQKYHVACYHEGVCEVCRQIVEVTEPRDYGYPFFEGFSDG